MDNKTIKDTKKRSSAIVIIAVLAAVAIASLTLLFYFNNSTRQAVQSERENYTVEIASQLTRSIDDLQNEYAQELEDGKQVFITAKPTSLAALAEFYPDRENSEHFVVTQSGKILDLSGKLYTIGDILYISRIALASDGEVVMGYTTLDLTHEYILFGQKIEPQVVGEETIIGLVAGITSDQFRENMTISLFDGVGAGYLISETGAIVLKPKDNSIVFSGYNLFYALSAGGVSDEKIEEIKAGMKTGSHTTSIVVNNVNWLISTQATEFNNNHILVAVPLSVTAADSYLSMNMMLVFAFIFVTAVAGIILTLLLFNFNRKRLEDKKAAATEAQATFLAKMSHDIRTPLNAVVGMLELASDPKHNRSEVSGFISQARQSTDYLLELINSMLDLQKISSGKMTITSEPFSFPELLDSTKVIYKPVLEDKGLIFTIKGESKIDTNYIGDDTKIKQILMNLLSNAMKFTPRGGSVTLTIARQSIDEKKDMVTLTVTDTGIGMSKEFLQHIFSPFEQEKSSDTSGYVGTGLGLNIVKSLSELLGGAVQVKSALGKGSTFVVSLPLQRSKLVPKTQDNSANKVVPFNHGLVLLAEDNEMNQQVAVLLVKERLHLDIDVVKNGKEAVDAIRKSKPGTYAAILMDVRMPVMDGLQAAKAIRNLDHLDAKKIPIIALSANTYEDDVHQSLNAGMDEHLSKPIDIVKLSSALHKYIK